MFFKNLFFRIFRTSSETKHDLRIDPLWPLVSMSQNQYEEIYLKTIQNSGVDFFNERIQDIAVSSLRLRKGYIIPIGAHPEDAVKTNEKWTYVIFLTVLADHLGYFPTRNDAMRWMKSVIPEQHLDWLDKDIAETLILSCCNKQTGTKHPILPIVRSAKVDVANRIPQIDFDHFANWIGGHLTDCNDKTMGINSADMLLHKVPEGLLIKNALVGRYIRDHNRIFTAKTFISALSKSSLFVGNMRYSVISTNGKAVVEGMVINDTKLQLDLHELNSDLRLI